MKQTLLFIALVISAGLVFTTSCSKDADPAPAPASTTSSTSTTAGTASTNSTSGNALIATWTKTASGVTTALTFKADLTYSAAANGTTFESGTYTNTGTSLTLNATTGATCVSKPGTYSYVISGTTITFTITSEACTSRGQALAGPWTKQ